MEAIDGFKRRRAVEKIIEKWGPLSKGEIEDKISTSFGLSGEILDKTKKNIWTDINYLVDENFILKIAFDRRGKFVETPDENKLKAYHYKFQSADDLEKVHISGQRILTENKANILASQEVSHYIRIKKGKFSECYLTSAVHFEIAGELYHLEIDLNNVSLHESVHIVFGANRNTTESTLKELKAKFGPYVIVLLFEDPYLSAITKRTPGSTVLIIENGNRLSLLDTGARNRVSFTSLNSIEAEKMLSELTFHQDKTKTRSWHDPEGLDLKELSPRGGVSLQKGYNVVRVGEETGFVLCSN